MCSVSSGLLGGQFSTLTLLLQSHVAVTDEAYCLVLSCWNMQGLLRTKRAALLSWSRENSGISGSCPHTVRLLLCIIELYSAHRLISGSVPDRMHWFPWQTSFTVLLEGPKIKGIQHWFLAFFLAHRLSESFGYVLQMEHYSADWWTLCPALPLRKSASFYTVCYWPVAN